MKAVKRFDTMKTHRRSATLTLSLALLAAGLSSPFILHSALTKAPTIRIADPDYLSFALIRLADQRGFFRRHKVKVELIRSPSGRDALDLMVEGRAEFAGAAGIPVVSALLDGQDLQIVAGLAVIDGAHAIIAPRGRGIRSPLDLRGKNVAVSSRNSSEYYLDRYLDFHGIGHQRVNRVYAEPGEIADVLADGRADAVCTWQPWTMAGKNYVRLGGDGIYTWHAFLVAKRSSLEHSPDAAQRLLKALMDAESYAVAHRQNIPSELAASYKMDVRTFETVWSSMRFGVSLDHAMLRGLEDEARWIASRRTGGAVPSPDFLGVFHFKGLSAVRPEAVTIVHRGEEAP